MEKENWNGQLGEEQNSEGQLLVNIQVDQSDLLIRETVALQLATVHRRKSAYCRLAGCTSSILKRADRNHRLSITRDILKAFT